MQQMDERLQLRETQDSASSGEHDKGVRWGQIRPSGGQRADLPRGRIMKKHPRLPPGTPLHAEGKPLAGGGVEGMGDGEAKLPIRLMGCS
jgi:hypothetical protein